MNATADDELEILRLRVGHAKEAINERVEFIQRMKETHTGSHHKQYHLKSIDRLRVGMDSTLARPFEHLTDLTKPTDIIGVQDEIECFQKNVKALLTEFRKNLASTAGSVLLQGQTEASGQPDTTCGQLPHHTPHSCVSA